MCAEYHEKSGNVIKKIDAFIFHSTRFLCSSIKNKDRRPTNKKVQGRALKYLKYFERDSLEENLSV